MFPDADVGRRKKRDFDKVFGISEQTVKNHFTHIYEKAWVPGRKDFYELFLDKGDLAN